MRHRHYRHRHCRHLNRLRARFRGQKVICIDRGDIAGGVTARTTAHLAPLCNDLTSEMIKLRGAAISKAFYESQVAAIDRMSAFHSNCDAQHALRYPRQATFHLLKYVRGLADNIMQHNGEFFANTVVTDIAENQDGAVTVKRRNIPCESRGCRHEPADLGFICPSH